MFQNINKMDMLELAIVSSVTFEAAISNTKSRIMNVGFFHLEVKWL